MDNISRIQLEIADNRRAMLENQVMADDANARLMVRYVTQM